MINRLGYQCVKCYRNLQGQNSILIVILIHLLTFIKIVESVRNIEITIKDTPIPKLSAIIPKVSASITVKIVLNNDCAEITDVKISLGTLSAISPINIGFLIFSTMYIPINAIIEIIHKSSIKKTPHIIPKINPKSNVIFEILALVFIAIFDESFDARDVIR